MTLDDIKVAIFLVVRYVRGANIWTTILVIFVMLLTFLNLVVIGGLLEGIIVGSLDGFRLRYAGDVFITANDNRPYIDRTQDVIKKIDGSPWVKDYSVRYIGSASLFESEEFYGAVNPDVVPRSVGASVHGVNPEKESSVVALHERIIEGSYLTNNDRGWILVGRGLVARHSPFGEFVLRDVHPGDEVYVSIGGGPVKKYRIRGVFATKSGEFDLSIVMLEGELRKILGRTDRNASQIAVRVFDGVNADNAKEELLAIGTGKYAKVQTPAEAIGPFLNDIRNTFFTLGAAVGLISLIVSSITIFIIIFVNAVSKQRHIGILKGIGVTPVAIEISYVLYALFYVIIGMILGLSLLYFFLIPYFQANPINFPFSDGILYVTTFGITLRLSFLVVTTIIASYIPAKIIVKKPAIQAIMDQ